MPTKPKFTTFNNMPIPTPVTRVTDLTPRQRQRAAAAMRQGFTLCDLLRLSRPEPYINFVSTEDFFLNPENWQELVGSLLYWAAFYPPQTTPITTAIKLTHEFYGYVEYTSFMDYFNELLPAVLYPTIDVGAHPPKGFDSLLKNKTTMYRTFPWLKQLILDRETHQQWYKWSESKTAVLRIARRMSEFVTRCDTTNLAPWATYTGNIYRGVRRRRADVKQYDFTKADVRKISADTLAVSFRTSYQSQYPVQSWTASWKRAIHFAEHGVGVYRDRRGTVPVIFASRATRQNSLFSPRVTNPIANELVGSVEDEVLRTVSTPDPAMTGVILLYSTSAWSEYDDWWNSGLFPPAVIEKLRASWKGKLSK